jgi:ABC-type Fe3+ transport system permease subunit
MFRFLARIFGLLCIAGAFLIAVVDGTRLIASGQYRPVRVQEIWLDLDPQGPARARQWIEQAGVPLLWDPVATSLLFAPAFLVLAVVGVVLMMACRRRPVHRIGYGRD